MPSAHEAESSSSLNLPSSSSKKRSYDAHQDALVKRALRKDYRSLIAKAEEARSNLAEHDAADLYKLIQDADRLKESVKTPNEGILDSKFLMHASDIGAQMARNLKLNSNAFDVDEYINRVARFVGGQVRADRRGRGGGGGGGGRRRRGMNARRRQEGITSDVDDEDEQDDDDDDDDEGLDNWNWHRLGRIAASHSRRAPTMDHLLGPLAITPKTRVQVARSRRLDRHDSQEVAPQKLSESDLHRSENETTHLVREIATLLERQGGSQGCSLFEFVIDPTSFSNTIENLFYLSFLIRDGKVSLDEDEDGVLRVIACDQPQAEEYEQGLTKRQIVLEMDYKTWKDLAEGYGIRRSIIPTRRETQTGLGQRGGWYG